MPQQIEQVTLDGGGGGAISLAPAPLLRYWIYTTVAVSIDTGEVSAVTGGECRMYKGLANPGNFLTGSRTPWLDTASFGGYQARITSPDYFTVVFTNCDPGAIATVVATFYEDK